MKEEEKYCDSLFRYVRRPTCAVHTGTVTIGGTAPLVVQSMCTTDTLDTEASVVQAKEIVGAGGRLVRFTAQTVRHAANMGEIRRKLAAEGCDVPLVADIHFNPKAAFEAARQVQKVRINPGNFIDKRARFDTVEYTEEEYEAELERLRVRLHELLEICRQYETALRIGVNHGSLSDRIMSRYGDTPAGMVASAMEFLRICRDENFQKVVVSMKSSNTQVMVHAYRLLCAAMRREGMEYPLHLGVTEAGEGEDGRIRSAVGIGALLNDGIGDTLRVSLTEHPAREIPVACMLAKHYDGRGKNPSLPVCGTESYRPYESVRRPTRRIHNIGGAFPPVVIGEEGALSPDFSPAMLEDKTVSITLKELSEMPARRIPEDKVLVLHSEHANAPAEIRAFFLHLDAKGVTNPVVIRRVYDAVSWDELAVYAAADLGMAFIDGMGDGLWIESRNPEIAKGRLTELAFGILQAARVRISRTEYISCPGCGRTLYSLEDSLREIKRKTGGLKGLKIAVMGCIVNGPGEMADADYGYVGSGPKRVTLYKGKEPVRRNVPQDEAVDALIELIKKNGDWRE